jgi:hypothetical protein
MVNNIVVNIMEVVALSAYYHMDFISYHHCILIILYLRCMSFNVRVMSDFLNVLHSH